MIEEILIGAILVLSFLYVIPMMAWAILWHARHSTGLSRALVSVGGFGATVAVIAMLVDLARMVFFS